MVDSQIVPEQERSNQLDLVSLYARRMSVTAANRKPASDIHDPWSSIELVQFGRPMPELPPETEEDDTEQFEPVVFTSPAPAAPPAMAAQIGQAALRGFHLFVLDLKSVPPRLQSLRSLLDRN
jgi:hypothetical protein